MDSLDNMAATIAARVNEQHAKGSDLDGNAGADLFSFSSTLPASNAGAARFISVAITDPREIAAAALTSGSGDNTNANLLFGIKDEKLFSADSETIGQFYSRLIYKVGSDEKDAGDGLTVQTSVVNQLKNRRDELSGVNLDEEAVNLIMYQKAYQASARFVIVLEALSDEILKLV
jgi:flagellar hook-associated protein 1